MKIKEIKIFDYLKIIYKIFFIPNYKQNKIKINILQKI